MQLKDMQAHVGEIVHESDLPERVRKCSPGLHPSPVQRWAPSPSLVRPHDQIVNIRGRRDAVERDAILDAMRDTHGDKAAAAPVFALPDGVVFVFDFIAPR